MLGAGFPPSFQTCMTVLRDANPLCPAKLGTAVQQVTAENTAGI